mmetsp:Transcript_8698/g.13768  ORF Transcript_8698/g.13768 Transcript_8698/m.13768 type:complete len:81 (+) Transcript_8698:1323-1565(+)
MQKASRVKAINVLESICIVDDQHRSLDRLTHWCTSALKAVTPRVAAADKFKQTSSGWLHQRALKQDLSVATGLIRDLKGS